MNPFEVLLLLAGGWALRGLSERRRRARLRMAREALRSLGHERVGL